MGKQKLFTAVSLVVLAALLFSGSASAYNDQIPDLPGYIESFQHPGKTQTPFQSLQDFEDRFSNRAPASESPPSLITYGKEFFPDLVKGTGRIFSRDNLPIALVGAGLAGLAFSVDHVDQKIKNYFQTRRPLDGPAKYGDMMGQGYYHIGIGAALLGAGELSNNKRLADTGVVTIEALLINCVATEGLKYTFGRTRPNGGNHMSFPSGHTSSTTTLAAAISEMYDWDLRIAVPLYATAVFVGASRIQENEHYLSDVIAGLTLGTIIGRSFARYHREKGNEKKNPKNISFVPLFEKDLKGGLFTVTW